MIKTNFSENGVLSVTKEEKYSFFDLMLGFTREQRQPAPKNDTARRRMIRNRGFLVKKVKDFYQKARRLKSSITRVRGSRKELERQGLLSGCKLMRSIGQVSAQGEVWYYSLHTGSTELTEILKALISFWLAVFYRQAETSSATEFKLPLHIDGDPPPPEYARLTPYIAFP